ncbi:hypothetical protein AB1Y20_007794 [Prymnesium parvum]|uniref:Uncharacterized protein n=1 Tax=Prymnesium parvum TaxID=97485 RepID=A0AB34IVY9_PRYPA
MQSEAEARLRSLLGRRQTVRAAEEPLPITPGAALAEEQQRCALILARLEAEEAAARRLVRMNEQLRAQLVAERRRTRSAERCCDELSRDLRRCVQVEEAKHAASTALMNQFEREMKHTITATAEGRTGAGRTSKGRRGSDGIAPKRQSGRDQSSIETAAAAEAAVRESLLRAALEEAERDLEDSLSGRASGNA